MPAVDATARHGRFMTMRRFPTWSEQWFANIGIAPLCRRGADKTEQPSHVRITANDDAVAGSPGGGCRARFSHPWSPESRPATTALSQACANSSGESPAFRRDQPQAPPVARPRPHTESRQNAPLSRHRPRSRDLTCHHGCTEDHSQVSECTSRLRKSSRREKTLHVSSTDTSAGTIAPPWPPACFSAGTSQARNSEHPY